MRKYFTCVINSIGVANSNKDKSNTSADDFGERFALDHMIKDRPVKSTVFTLGKICRTNITVPNLQSEFIQLSNNPKNLSWSFSKIPFSSSN